MLRYIMMGRVDEGMGSRKKRGVVDEEKSGDEGDGGPERV